MFETLIDNFVKALAPTDKSAICSIRPLLIAFICLPMILLTDIHSTLQIRTSFLLTLNIVVRLLYPSCYYPASASKKGFLASPMTARCIAFVAEFGLYEVWAIWVDIPFWNFRGHSNYLWLLVLFAECISTSGVLL